MIAEQHQTADGNFVALKRLLFATASLSVTALGLMTSFAPDANAVPIPYVIPSSPVSFTTGVTGQGSLSGSFTYDSSDNTYTNIDLNLSSTSYVVHGPFTVVSAIGSSASTLLTFGSADNADLELEFVNPLSTQPDPIKGVEYLDQFLNSGSFPANGQSDGTAFPTIPEPSSIAILGAALGLFGLRRRNPRTR